MSCPQFVDMTQDSSLYQEEMEVFIKGDHWRKRRWRHRLKQGRTSDEWIDGMAPTNILNKGSTSADKEAITERSYS